MSSGPDVSLSEIRFPDFGVRRVNVRRAMRLEWLTISWNSIEAVIALVSGLLSGSIALVGFGIDSVIEVSSGLALLWRLSIDADEVKRAGAERLTLRIVGLTFIALSAYVAVDSLSALSRAQAPESSPIGIVLAALSLIVMPVLARAKRRIAADLRSDALHADSKQTDICAYLSAILLGGLLLNALFGWWWADPLAALMMVPVIANEGRLALAGKSCCASC